MDISEKVDVELPPTIPELLDCYLPLSRTFLVGKDEGQERVLLPASLGDGVPILGYKRG